MHIHIHHIHTSNKNIPTTHTLTPTGLPSDPSSHPPSLIRQVSIGSGGYHTLAFTLPSSHPPSLPPSLPHHHTLSTHPPTLPLSPIRQVSIGSGGYHTLALTQRGDVYAWGHHRVHQLGPVDNSLLLRNEGN